MIRERRDEDLDRLCDLLGELDEHARVLGTRHPRDWLQEVEAERSWVFDQAPVRVAPTRNVVGHVQVSPPPEARWVRDVAAQTSRQVDELLVIGRLFVKPAKHDYGIARYLLKESVKHVETRGRLPVLDPADLALIPPSLPTKLGFTELHTEDHTPSPLIRAE
ncbi:GNAT superfamily N-acetyltransferase [Actinopolyspora lacussalsi]|nr:GNAT superfamily N-acetyltransferase [Actinopolyspora lacussalsi]